MSKTNFPSSELQIRPASFNDIPYIQEIARKTWPVAYNEILNDAQLDYMLNKFYSTQSLHDQMERNHHFYLALLNYTPVGFASFSHEVDATYKLQKLYVLPTVQKHGAGKSMLQLVEEVVKSMEGKILRLNVNRSNSAQSFYERNGYKVIYEEDVDIGDGYFMNDYVMEKKLLV